MLKKMVVIAAAFAALLISAPAQAEEDDFKVSVGGKVGWLFLQDEPYSDLVENNWLIGGDLTLWLPQGFGFGVDVKFTTKDQDAEDIDNYDVDFEWNQIPISFNAYFRYTDGGSEIIPYIGGGLSVVYTDVTATQGTDVTEADETSYGFNIIGGAQYGNFFIEGQYIWSEASLEEINFLKDDEEDINVGGFNVAIGIRF